jgi:hypothetical protein
MSEHARTRNARVHDRRFAKSDDDTSFPRAPREQRKKERPLPQVPLLTCLPAATRISIGCTGTSASRRSLNELA